MKTLDEIIKALEICTSDLGGCEGCPYDPDCESHKKWDEAIYYLKEYQRYQNTPSRNGHMALVDYFEEQQKNGPLMWDELKDMVGKPVWVEVDGNWYGKFWAFVEVENDSCVNFYQKGQEYPEDLWKRDIGKTWQAYRKER